MARFIFLVLSLTLFAGVGSSQSPAGSQPDRPKPVINLQEQPGAPLKITVETKWATSDAQMLELYVMVENVSDLEIRSYAWRTEMRDGKNNDGCLLHNAKSPGKFLQPGDADGKSTWRRFPLKQSIIQHRSIIRFCRVCQWHHLGS
jgi:hypothetical protein